MASVSQGTRTRSPKVEQDCRPEASGPSLEERHGAPLEVAPLEVAHPLLRDPELRAKLTLRPSTLPSHRSKQTYDRAPLHASILRIRTLPMTYR